MLSIIGLLVMYIGFGITIFGFNQNKNLEVIITSAIRNGTWTPGDKWIAAGIIVIAIGTITILINSKWKPKKKKY